MILNIVYEIDNSFMVVGYEWERGTFDSTMMNKEDEEHSLPHLIQVHFFISLVFSSLRNISLNYTSDFKIVS